MQRTDPGLRLFGAGQLALLWVGYYVIALFGFLSVITGQVSMAVFLIPITELIWAWRAQPRLETGSEVRLPVPARWQKPVWLLIWYELITSCWSAGVGAVLGTIFAAVFAIVAWPHHFGTPNVAVLILFAVWLLTRPLWIPPLRRAIWSQTKGAKAPSRYLPEVSVKPDGVEVGLSSMVLFVGFAELDEVRTLDWSSAQAYWLWMERYDRTVTTRAEWDLYRFLTGQLPRPSMLNISGTGTHLLMRSARVLYLISNAEQSGAAAVTAWQAWRMANAPSAAPTA